MPRPAAFKSQGFWFRAGDREMHIGVEDHVDRRATRAHVAYEVDDIAAWREKVVAANLPIKDQPKIPGYERFHFREPFGNNIELIQHVAE